MEQIKLLRFPHKQLRAAVIKNYMQVTEYKKAVCFSCGNAATALIEAGVETLHIGETGVLSPCKWWQQAEIAKWFPNYFDATSGHLPASLMQEIGEKFKDYLGVLDETVYVPTGSGETLVCLKFAYPQTKFIAVYNLDNATKYEEKAPLNKLVELLAEKIIFAENLFTIKGENYDTN